jgi:hypothetical protein
MEKKAKRMTKMASLIVTGCILLGSIHALACPPSILQSVADTFDSVSIVQPSSLYERSTNVGEETWTNYPGDDCAQAVAVNGGDVYMAGYANRSTGSQYDAYLAKYDAELRRVWNITWGGSGNQKAYGVAVSGNYVYITGSATNASTGYLNMFVNKYGTNGTLIWNRNYSAGAPSVNKEGYAIAATADAVYIAGYDSINHMVWKYYQNGTRNWYNSTAINMSSCATGITVYEGWVYVTGYSNYIAPNRTQVFVRSLNFNATSGKLYVKPLGTATDERGYGIAVNDSYIYVTGRSGNYTSKSSYSALVQKLGTNFAVNWTRYWDRPGMTNQWDSGLGIAVKYGYVLFTGYSKETSGAPSYVGQAIIGGYWANGTSAFNKSSGLPGFVDDEFRGIAAGRNCMYVVGGYSTDLPYYKIFNTRIYKFSAITHSPDVTYVGGSTGHQLSWTLYTGAGSLTQRDYTIYQNGILNRTAQWAASPSGFPITTSIDSLPVGKHNITIVAGLIDGDVVQDTTYVTITNVLPVITMPATAAIEHNSSGNVLSSTITDLSTGVTKYWILQNGSTKQSDSWVHNVPVVWDVDGLGIGIYNITIVVNDGYGLNVSGTTMLNVSNWPPVITMPATVAINGAIGGNVLSSTIADRSTGVTRAYVVYRNGRPMQSGFWVHNLPVFWNVDGLAAGSYNFTIVVTDGLGLTGRGTTIATVSATQPCGTCDPGPGVAALTLAIITLGLVATHLAWHVYRKYVPGRKTNERPLNKR